ncbi:MAG: hypothetical protein LBK27_02375 [Treponema sp.]|jgi:hypothetical protein|nr:hypothetical protein [Treponema sp.]
MKIFFRFTCCAALILCLGACESLPFNYYRGVSWFLAKETAAPVVRIRLVSVSVDRSGSWASVEKEIRGLAPLLFLDQGCRVVAPGEEADYTADIRAREREYASGWETKRSLALELRLWPAEIDPADDAFEQSLPLAAGRVTNVGNRSFSSSGTTGRMLDLAVKKTIRALRKTGPAPGKPKPAAANGEGD